MPGGRSIPGGDIAGSPAPGGGAPALELRFIPAGMAACPEPLGLGRSTPGGATMPGATGPLG